MASQNYRQPNSLFNNSFFILTWRKTPNLCITDPLWEESTEDRLIPYKSLVNGWFPEQKAGDAENVLKSWCHHEIWEILRRINIYHIYLQEFFTGQSDHHNRDFHRSSNVFTGQGLRTHDDVIKWKHFPRNWPFVREIHRSPVNFPHKGQWRGALMFSLIYAWINGWVNNREAGDLRLQHGHYDVIVMQRISWCLNMICRLSMSDENLVYKISFSPVWMKNIDLFYGNNTSSLSTIWILWKIMLVMRIKSHCSLPERLMTFLWTLLSLGLVKILTDYIRENCNNVRVLLGKCQGISTVVVRGNPVYWKNNQLIKFRFIGQKGKLLQSKTGNKINTQGLYSLKDTVLLV